MHASRTLTILGLMAAAVFAKPKEEDPVKGLVKEIQSAVGKGDAAAARAAFERAVKMRPGHDDKKFQPVAKAVAKAAGHKDADLAKGAVETLGKLKVKGSAKLLGRLLSPPAKVADDRAEIYMAAIKAAGEIHDDASMKTLEKLVLHRNAGFAVAGAEALAGYTYLDPKPRTAMLGRLVKTLGQLEKSAARAKDEEDKASVARVRGALLGSMNVLARKDGLATAAEWSKWLKEEAKKS